MCDIDALVEYIQQQGYRCYVIYRAIVIFTYAGEERLSFSLSFYGQNIEWAKMDIECALYQLQKALEERTAACLPQY